MFTWSDTIINKVFYKHMYHKMTDIESLNELNLFALLHLYRKFFINLSEIDKV